MSRTFRRTDLACVRHRYICEESNEWWRSRFNAGLTYEQYKEKTEARFHSDGRSYLGTGTKGALPRWFRSHLQDRPFRRDCKRVIKLNLRFDEWDDMSIRRPLRDGWLYY